MAKVSLIWTLLIFHGCLFRHGSTTTIYITPSQATTTAAVATTVIVPGVAETTTAVGGGVSFTTAGGEVSNTAISGEVTTTLVGEGDVTTTGGAVTNTASVGVIATTTTGIGGRVTSTVGGRETSSAVDKSVVSPTSTPTGPPPSSVCVYYRLLGVEIHVKVTVACSGGLWEVLINILKDVFLKLLMKVGFRPCGAEVKSATCNSPFEGKLMLSLHAGGPSGITIEQVFKDGLQQGAFGDDIRADNTVYTLEFQGVDIKKTPKPGECDRVCCDGAGGELLVEVTCTPADKCKGIDLSDRKDDGYCQGEPKAYCECSNGLQDLPSFAFIAALGLTSLMKSIFSS